MTNIAPSGPPRRMRRSAVWRPALALAAVALGCGGGHSLPVDASSQQPDGPASVDAGIDAAANQVRVVGVTSATPDGTYGIGAAVSIQVVFSSAVHVSAAPSLSLNSGADASAQYTSGTGTATLEFVYTVGPGQATVDLDYLAAGSLMPGGTIRDSDGRDVNLTLPLPGSPGSLGANKAIVIDPGPPSVPILRRPINNSYVGTLFVTGSRRPVFTWAASSGGLGALTYELELSTDASFAANVIQAATSALAYQPAVELPVALTPPVGARFYWRVRACAGQCSQYSAPRWVNVARSSHDFNGDGFADVVVGAPTDGIRGGTALVYFGGVLFDTAADGVLTGGSQFGRSVAAAGDVNGDGFADVVVGAPGYFSDGITGTSWLYYGGAGSVFDTTPDGLLTGAAIRDQFGYSVASAGDVNGDGFDDIIVGAPNSSAGGMAAGRASIYFGGATFDATADGVLTGTTVSAGSGWSVSSAGDVNGDGFADVVVGAPYGGTPSRAAVYLGAAGSTFDAGADALLVGLGSFGEVVATAGDVNGDGFADVVVGAHNDSTGPSNAGAAKVFLGGPGTTLDATADGTLTGPGVDYELGIAVASAGDVNGDGFDDIVVGARHLSGDGLGHAYVYCGAPGTTFDTVPDGSLSGQETGDVFGFAVASAGDTNGDGFDEVVVGAPYNTMGGANSGQVTIYRGAPGATFDAVIDGTLTGTPRDVFGLSVGR